MGASRIVYQNWIVELGRDPNEDLTKSDGSHSDEKRQMAVREAVIKALECLSEEERSFVERFHFMGQSYREISEETGKDIYRLDALHKRALRRLRVKLEPLVRRLYGITAGQRDSCPICESEYRNEIDRLISSKEESDTWSEIIRSVKSRYNIRISTPQILIGHEKYH